MKYFFVIPFFKKMLDLKQCLCANFDCFMSLEPLRPPTNEDAAKEEQQSGICSSEDKKNRLLLPPRLLLFFLALEEFTDFLLVKSTQTNKIRGFPGVK